MSHTVSDIPLLPSQLYQSERTPLELQRSSHFRTIERQDSFDLGYEPVISCGLVGRVTVVRPQPRTQSLDLSGHALQTTPLFKEVSSHIAHSTPSDIFRSCASTETNADATQTFKTTSGKSSSLYPAEMINCIDSLGSQETTTGTEHTSSALGLNSPGTENNTVSVIEPKNGEKRSIKESNDGAATATSPRTTEGTNPKQQDVLSEQLEQGSAGSATVSEGDSGIDPCAEGGEEDGGPGGIEGSAAVSLLTNKNVPKAEGRSADGGWTAAETSSKVEQQDKKKGIFLLLPLFPCYLGVLKVSRGDDRNVISSHARSEKLGCCVVSLQANVITIWDQRISIWMI